jgi:exonuclease VII small subunit
MIIDSDVRNKIEAYLANSISLREFEDWLTETSWNMHKDSFEATIELVNDIELSLAEFSNSHLSVKELQQRLLQAQKQVRFIKKISTNVNSNKVVTTLRGGPLATYAVQNC